MSSISSCAKNLQNGGSIGVEISDFLNYNYFQSSYSAECGVISAMNFNENNEKLLNVWQTLQFKFDDPEKSGFERADAARSLMFQLEKLFDRYLCEACFSLWVM